MDGPADGTQTPAVGAECVTTRRIGGASRPSTSELTHIDPPRTWGVRGTDGPVRAAVDVLVEPVTGSRSRLTIGNLGRRLDDLVRQFGGNVAQSADDGFACEAQRALVVPALLPEPHEFGCCIGCLSQICQKVIGSSGHRSTASARMRSSRGLRALRATTSTPTPRRSSKSWNKPM